MFCFRRFDLRVLIVCALASTLAAQDPIIPLTNWAAPLYWQAPAPARPQGKAMELQPLTVGAITPPLVFVGMTPCRVMDTRAGYGQPGPFGPPALGAGETRTLPLPTHPACGVSSTAQAYSLNVTVLPKGPLGFVTIWNTGTTRPVVATLNALDGQIHNNAAIVPAGTNGSIDVFVTDATDMILDINGYYAPPSALTLTLAAGSASAPSVAFTGDPGTGVFSPSSGTLGFATAGTSRLTIDGTGKVVVSGSLGIGVPAPGQRLHVGDGNILVEGGGETALRFKLDQTIQGYSGTSVNPMFDIGRIVKAGDGDPELRFLYSDETAAERSVFEVDRKGIVASVKPTRGSHFEGFTSGTDSEPVFRLNSYPAMRLEMGNGGSRAVDVAIQHEAAGTLTFLSRDTSLSPTTPWVERMRIDSSGNTGIGAPSPRDALEVNGEVRVANCVKNSSGTQIAGACPSDLRLKTNIQPFPPVLDKLARMQPVHFNWRAAEFPEYHFGDSRSYGLVAQDVEQNFPELISEDARGFKAVNYSELPLLLLEAVRELKTGNDALRQRIQELEERSRSLERRLAESQEAR